MSAREKNEVAAIFKYFEGRIRYYDPSEGWICAWNSAGTYYDDGAELVQAFSSVSKGRKKDPDDSLAAKRLNRRLKMMVDDGWMERWRQGNQCEYAGEAKWQYVYRPPQWLLREWKEGKSTPEESAKKYQGVE